MWHSVIEKPEAGRRIVAVYADGSGASMFLVTEEGCLGAEDGELHDENLFEYGYIEWAYLPEYRRLWFEGSNDQYAFEPPVENKV